MTQSSCATSPSRMRAKFFMIPSKRRSTPSPLRRQEQPALKTGFALREMRPFRTEHRPYLEAEKSIFTKIVGEPHSGGFELFFAAFLEAAGDVAAFAKNYLAVGFKLDYVQANGDLANYTPDFIVRTTDGKVWIVETKGRAELDLPQKMARLKQWCADATAAEQNGQRYDFVFVDQTGFEKHGPEDVCIADSRFYRLQNMTDINQFSIANRT